MKDYIARFKMAMLEIYNLDESVVMLGMKREFCSSRFTYLLDQTYSKFYLELVVYIQKYIYVEEGALTQREDNGKPKKSNPKESQAKVRLRIPTHPTNRVLSRRTLLEKMVTTLLS